jgi:hypothetical protein
MTYIFLIIFAVIQCVRYNIKEYAPKGYLAYSINNGEKIEIPSFYKYLYSKSIELNVSKNYKITLYEYQSDDQHNIVTPYWTVKSEELIQLEEFYKKQNNDFTVMFSPINLKNEDEKKLFFEFLKNNGFPRIIVILRHSNDRYYIDEKLYTYFYNIFLLKNEFIFIKLHEFRFTNGKDDDTFISLQLFSLEKNKMVYIYNPNSFTRKVNIDTAEYAKFILEKINYSIDNREEFKSIPKIFIIVGEYKLNSISTKIFTKAGFSYTNLDSENYYLVFFKTDGNFQPIKNDVKEFHSLNFSLSTFV